MFSHPAFCFQMPTIDVIFLDNLLESSFIAVFSLRLFNFKRRLAVCNFIKIRDKERECVLLTS